MEQFLGMPFWLQVLTGFSMVYAVTVLFVMLIIAIKVIKRGF